MENRKSVWSLEPFALALGIVLTGCSGTAIVDPTDTTSSSGTTTGTTTSTGATSSTSSGGMSDCDALSSSYVKALEGALKCDPQIDVPQCTQTVPDRLDCPCPTYVNPGNAAALKEIAELATAWLDQDCGANVACPEVLCPELQGGFCASNGLCENALKD